MKMGNLGLYTVYAVHWNNGGGVFLTRTEAEISQSTALETRQQPSECKLFANATCNLSQNVALAASWILQHRNQRLLQHSPPPSFSPINLTPPPVQAASASVASPPRPTGTPPVTPHNNSQIHAGNPISNTTPNVSPAQHPQNTPQAKTPISSPVTPQPPATPAIPQPVLLKTIQFRPTSKPPPITKQPHRCYPPRNGPSHKRIS